MSSSRPIRIGTRGSDLALWQANYIKDRLELPVEIIIIKTSGDQIQHLSLDKVEGKGFFTKELEKALYDDVIDLAVHSYKDLPTEDQPGLEIAAVPERAPVRDVIVRRASDTAEGSLWGLASSAKVGTSSLRRKAHLLSKRGDLSMVDLRGNVPTRFGRVAEKTLDAVVLAEAGLIRLGLFARAQEQGLVLEPLSVTDVCPAPAQGALAVQIRSSDEHCREALAPLHDQATAEAVDAERALLGRFGGGCHLPLGVFCDQHEGGPRMRALVASPDGKERIEAVETADTHSLNVDRVYATLIEQGAERYL